MALTYEWLVGRSKQAPAWVVYHRLMKEYGWTYQELLDTPVIEVVRAIKLMELEAKADAELNKQHK